MKLLSRLATTLTRPSGCCPGNLSAGGWDAERNCRSFVELWVVGAGVSTHRHYLRSAEAGGSCYRPRRTSGRLKLRMRGWCPSWLWWPPSGGRWAKRAWHWRCWPAAPGWTLDLGRGKKWVSFTILFFTTFRPKRKQLTRERCCSCELNSSLLLPAIEAMKASYSIDNF